MSEVKDRSRVVSKKIEPRPGKIRIAIARWFQDVPMRTPSIVEWKLLTALLEINLERCRPEGDVTDIRGDALELRKSNVSEAYAAGLLFTGHIYNKETVNTYICLTVEELIDKINRVQMSLGLERWFFLLFLWQYFDEFDLSTLETEENIGPAFASMADPEQIGAALKAARERLGMTQDQMADLLDTSRTSIIRIEKGKHSPTSNSINAYVAALGGTATLKLDIP